MGDNGQVTGVLLFDGDCGFCTSCARWLQRVVPTDARIAPYQRAPLTRLGVTTAQAAESLQWVDDAGRRAAGPQAIAALLQGSTSPGWQSVGKMLAAEPAQAIAWPTYRWVARNRGRIPSGRPAMADPEPERRAPAPKVRSRRASDLRGCVRLLYQTYSADHQAAAIPQNPATWLTPDGLLGAWVVRQQAFFVGHVAVTRVGEGGLALRLRELTGHEPQRIGLVTRLLLRPEADSASDGVGPRLLQTAAAAIRKRGLVPVASAEAAPDHVLAAFDSADWQLVGIYPGVRYYRAPSATD